jgi:ankyrin repeat protein
MGNMLSAPSLRVVCAKGRKPSPRRTPPKEKTSDDKVLSVPDGDPALVRYTVPPAGSGSRKGPAATDLEVPAAAGPSTPRASQQLVELVRRGDTKALAALLDRRGAAPALGGLLHAASEEGHEHVINVLLMAGVSAAEVDEDGQTALHVAVANGHVEAAERLSRADPCLEMGVVDKYLMTPLHLACEDGLPDMVAMLLSRGGDTLVVARSPQPSPDTGGDGKGLVGFSTHVPPQPGPGGTLELSQNGSSGGSLLFIAKRHSHDEAADLIRRASHGEKLPLPARLSQRSNAWSNDSELSRRESLRSNSGSRAGSSSSSPGSSPASRGCAAYSPGSLKSIASGVALEGMESLPGPVMGDLSEVRV